MIYVIGIHVNIGIGDAKIMEFSMEADNEKPVCRIAAKMAASINPDARISIHEYHPILINPNMQVGVEYR